MEFMFAAIDKPTSYHPRPPPSTVTYFSDEAVRAGFWGPDFGRANARNPSREEIVREIEKEKIRREVIAAEIMRNRLREEREMILDREIMAAFRRPHEGFSLLSASAYGPRVLEERLGYRNGHVIGGFETLPFHQVAEPWISEINPSLEAMPGKNFSGAKRKPLTLLEAGASEIHSVDLKKKPEEEWSCSICQVRASSEHNLNQHLLGKKHKAKEALGQSAVGTGNDNSNGVFPKKVGQPT